MSFLIVSNGLFSPYVSPVEHSDFQSTHPITSVKAIIPKKSQDFDGLLQDSLSSQTKGGPQLEAYQKVVKKFEHQRKRYYAHDIMSSPVHMIKNEMKVSDGLLILKKFGHRHLPVINENGTILGMASDREFINQNENKLCSEVMLKKVIVADEYASINQLAIIFLQEQLNAVPIINNKKEIVGIVTITDILKYVILNTEFLTRG